MQGLVSASCPVCRHGVAALFFNGDKQTLATLGWPTCADSAQTMPKYSLDFVQCPRCTHVWNRSFSYDDIPYSSNPNRMFNDGMIWKGHLLNSRDLIFKYVADAGTVIDIGCGEGHFVRGLAETANGIGRFVGFDPSGSSETGRGLELYVSYFEPLRHMPEFKPDVLVIRHVLEHLTHPIALLEEIAWGALDLDKPAYLFVEVPCIDKVFDTGRLADFFYEHVSHFTTESFRWMLKTAGEIVELGHGYAGEVVFAIVKIEVNQKFRDRAIRAIEFSRSAECAKARIRKQLDDLAAQGRRVAIWGGTGKAAAFINHFGADAKRFPLVVDSDQNKVGTFVPGAGQIILFRDYLKQSPVEIVIIPSQWRAQDIVSEMMREGISAELVLIEHKGCLIDFHNEPHPYSSIMK